MSFEDRDWIREPEAPAWSLRGLPAIPVLISVTVFCFIVQQAVENGSVEGGILVEEHLALSRRGVLGGEFWQPVTYLLLHGGLGHLFWNMVALWAFGGILRDRAGDRGVWVNYAVGGLAGAAACVAWESLVPAAAGSRVVGASGAVTAVLVAATLRAPRAPIHLFLVPAPIPLWVLGAVYLAMDLLAAIQAWSGGARGTVAVQAHLGGAAGAVILFLAASRGGRRPSPPPRRHRSEAVGDGEALAPAPSPGAAGDPAVEERVDALLERIHAAGMGSLTEEEKEFLKKASERYRGRGR